MAAPLRIFVTGTDTGVGKTEVSAALLSLLADAGLHPAPMKPYESGCADRRQPADALTLRAAARSSDPLEDICPHRFRAPLAPGIAARRQHAVPSIDRTLQAFRRFDRRSLVVEGAGGLLVPIDPERDVIDLIALLRLPVLLVARAGLGTLNHSGLALEALRRRRIKVRAVVLVRSSSQPDPSVRDNPALIAERHGVAVLGPVPFVPDPLRRRAAFRRTLRPLFEGT
ncbi:MAG: dethiobiotin synthase [Myxococcaceae bacterium]